MNAEVSTRRSSKSAKDENFGFGRFPGSTPFLTLLVALLAIALYLPSIGFDFSYDSNPMILIDTFIHQPRHIIDVLTLHVMTMDVVDFNRPMNLLTLLIDSLLWGKNPAGYHLSNLLLHGMAAALAFRWIFTLAGERWPAFLAALLFAVHPLNCEAVAEVCNRKDMLATLFMLAGLLCATRFKPDRSGWLPATGTVAFFFLSVASKESGIAGPAILAAYWFLFRSREKRGPWLLLISIAAAAVGAFLVVRFALEPKNSIVFIDKPSPLAPTWDGILQIQTRIWAAEFLRIVWPSPGSLCADYNGYSIRNIGLVPAVLGVAALLAVQSTVFVMLQTRYPKAARAKRTRTGISNEVPDRSIRLIAFAAAVFWFPLLPVSNFIPIYRPMADRFLYMPLLGVALTLAVLMAGIGRVWRVQMPLTPVVATVTLAAIGTLAVLTWKEEQIWRDSLSLWQATAERNPFSFNASLGLGSAWTDHHQPEKAFEPLQRAVALSHGKRAEPFGEMALAYDALGRQQDAALNLARAEELDSRYKHPDMLLKALQVDPVQAQRLSIIAARSRLTSF